MVSKKHLGAGYLIGLGISVFGTLATGVVLPFDFGEFVNRFNFMTLFSGLIIAVGFTLTGVALVRSNLSGQRIWRIAIWSSVGLWIPSILIILLVLFAQQVLQGLAWRSVAVINIAGGGIVGVLFGTIVELRAEYNYAKELNQRNSVFLRLFRHDIRNSATVIKGHTDSIARNGTGSQSAEAIDRQVDHILRLSDAARQLDSLNPPREQTDVDVVAVVRDRIETFREMYPDADFEVESPPDAQVQADALLSSVVDNLLRNAIEHTDCQPRIQITVRPTAEESEQIELRIRDNGPGIPEDELAVHSQVTETALQHSEGVGLWLVRWIVDSYGGEFSLENDPDGGAIASVKIPTEQRESSPTGTLRQSRILPDIF